MAKSAWKDFSGFKLNDYVVTIEDKYGKDEPSYNVRIIKADLNTTFSEKFFKKSTYYRSTDWVNTSDKLRYKQQRK